ncbi:hypothetical protein GGTG_13874 [Gaeumannomyces tritici R3-111a-1]|uniref:Uncharacterized protein n=1 Tax=Gaeumannomyces tritici (strain R3-111a-1) TaxID=644352 RepID=J3PK27_GAET3|nr:hypothetical protein GGTG_13874 [Gaeumannomyces tritici R3-111a-1]EJT68552.1 hypothetical protein GGTG_13874 [Gaeumannomyces tritici R3-111a-1]
MLIYNNIGNNTQWHGILLNTGAAANLTHWRDYYTVRSTGETARQKAGSVKCTDETARQKRKKGALAASRARTPRGHAGKLPVSRLKYNGEAKR